jgi:dihydrofolate reductase
VIEIYSSSDEEDFFADVTQDVEFAKWLFGDLNYDLLRPLSNGKVIVISDSDEET